MTHLTSSSPSRRPRWLGLFAGTAFPGRALRISHVHCVALMTCRALRPRGCPDTTAQNAMSDGVFWGIQPIDHPRSRFNGALSLQPEGLRPITSLSTLDPHRYPYRPKTRYQVRWVPASWAAISAASKTAPRGAQIRTYYDFVASCGELNPQRFKSTCPRRVHPSTAGNVSESIPAHVLKQIREEIGDE